MRKNIFYFFLLVIVNAALLSSLGGCSKKQVQVALPEPEPEPVVDTTPEVVPVEMPQVDSSAIIAAYVRDALQNIYFDFNKYNLRQDALERLQTIGRVLMEHGNVTISIEGHCDERGTSEYNMGLGENRANAAKQWLVSYGIGDYRIQTTSYGKERLAAHGCTDEPCHQQNRRCEFSLASY